MTRLSDLQRLVELRSHREERARAAAAAAAARLDAAQAAEEAAQAAIDAHDDEASARETRFFEAMRIRPFSGAEVSRGQDGLVVAGHRRDELLERRLAAREDARARREVLDECRAQWRARRRAHDTLAQAHAGLERSRRAEAEATGEREADEENADRRGCDAERAQ